MKNKQSLPARTVLDNLNILAPREEQAINRFLKSSPQIEHCRMQRNRLLESQTDLRISFVCWQLAFKSACPEYHKKNPTEWHEFDEEISSHHSDVDQIMRCIISISKAWGKDVVQHYDWQSVGLHNCNQLRSLSRKLPSWPVASNLLNYAILERIHRTDKRTPEVKDQANPVERWDAMHALEFASEKEALDLSQLPEGYGVDCYGLIVRERFAARIPSSSPQQHRTSLHDGDSGSPFTESPQTRCAPSISSSISPTATNASSAETLRVKTTRFPSSQRATRPPGLTSPSPTPPASPEQHEVSSDDENSGVADSAVRHGSSIASTSPTSPAQSLSPVFSSSRVTALQTSRVTLNSAALSRDTEHSVPSAQSGNAVSPPVASNSSGAGCLQSNDVACIANTSTDEEEVLDLFARLQARGSPLVSEARFLELANWLKKRKKPHDAHDELVECGARAQKRVSIAQRPLSTRVTDNVSQSRTPRPSPLPHSIDLPGTHSTPVHPSPPINHVPPTAEDDPNWPFLFTKQNFGDMKAGLLDECFHQEQSKMLIDDIPQIRSEGYVHWKDEIIGTSIGLMNQDSFWTSDGWGILNSTLANRRIRKILRGWFSRQPCKIVHWMWWGHMAHSDPIFLVRADAKSLANGDDLPYLGLHISCQTADIRYYARSHLQYWPAHRGMWFTNSTKALQGHELSEGLSHGFTVFDPRINFQFVEGSAMTIIFGPQTLERSWVPLPVKDPKAKATFEKMEADGVSFNFEYVGE